MTTTIIQQAQAILAAHQVDPALSKADTITKLSELLATAPWVDQLEKGPFAFPFTMPARHEFESFCPGMTLRDYFAAKAMQGCMSAGGHLKAAEVCTMAYKMADAMLSERAK